MSCGSLTTALHTFASGASVQTKQLFSGRQQLMSIKVVNNSTTANTVTFYDGTSASGKAILRVFVGTAKQNLDFDMHGALIDTGLFVSATDGSGKENLSVSAQYR